MLPKATATLRRNPRRLARRIGLPYSEIKRQGFHFPVTEVSCHYSYPLLYNEVVKIETELAELGRATLRFNYRTAWETGDLLLATGSTKHARLHRPRRPRGAKAKDFGGCDHSAYELDSSTLTKLKPG